jgi:hypothetical protein
VAYEIVFIDTETTGIHPEREIWEVAMVGRTASGEESEPAVMQINVDLSKADPFALKINRFYERYYEYNGSVSDSVVYSEYYATKKIERFTRGAHIVGAVPSFDTEGLDRLLRRNEILPAWHYHLIDVETLAIGYLMGIDAETHGPGPKLAGVDFKLPWKSDELSRAIGVEPPTEEERHTALGDVKWAMRTYDKVMGIN